MLYIVFYAHLQRIAKDYKEMMAAVIGILYCGYHIARTIWGLVQLYAFSSWCRYLLERMRLLRMISYNKFVDGFGDDVHDWDGLMKQMCKFFKVNNTIVDNEFGGTDLAVAIDRGKMDLAPLSTWFKNGKGSALYRALERRIYLCLR